MTILVVGSVAYDEIITPFASRKRALGGSAVYFGLAAHHFCQSYLIGVVGDDFKASDKRLLSEHGLNIDGIVTKPGKTFFWKGEYLANWNDRVTHDTQLNVFESFDPHITEEGSECPFVFLGNIDPVLQGKVLDQANHNAYVAMDTMNFWINNHRANLLETLRRIDLLIINDSEAMMLSNERHLVDAAKTILDMGPKTLVIKRGEHGAMLFQGDKLFTAPAYPLCRVEDPTGAGDAFAGGLFGYLAKSGKTDFETMKKAVIYGSVLGSFTVEQFSVDALVNLHKSNISDRYNQFVDLTHFETGQL